MRQGTDAQPTKLSFVSHRHCTMQNSFHLSQFCFAEYYPSPFAYPSPGYAGLSCLSGLLGRTLPQFTLFCLTFLHLPLSVFFFFFLPEGTTLATLVEYGLCYSRNLLEFFNKQCCLCSRAVVLVSGAVSFVNDHKS